MSGKGKFRIEPFKHRVELDAQVSPRDHRAPAPQFFHESHAPETNFHPDHSLTLRAALNPRFAPPQYAEKTWKVLKDAIHEIHHRNASGLSFEELYRNAYNMVLHRHGDALYKGLVSLVTEHLRGVAGEVNAERGEGFLGELIKRWDHHTHSMQMVRDILMYMDRIYVQPNGLKPVHDLGLQLWRDQVMRGPGIKSRVRDAVLGAVNRERCGEKVDTHQLRAVTAMLMDLGEDCYAKDFEEPFLAATTEFYRAEAQTFLADSDCAQYLRKVESRLAEEQARVLEYMNARTVKTAVARCEEELLTGPMRQTLSMPGSGLSSMLVGDRVEDLRLVYKLFRRVPNGLKFVKEMVFEHVSAEGKSLVTDPETAKEPGRYVEGLLRMKDKYGGIVDAAFDGDRQFINALHLSFENFVNLNNRSAEYLSLYVDDQLRRSLKGAEEEEVEATLDRAIVLFRFLREKDVFQKYYQEHLSKRLLGGRTTSDDAERSLVVKLKTECGYQFTTKFEGMFNDIRTSRDSMSAFRTHLEERAASGDLAMAAEPSSSALTADADGVKVKTAGGRVIVPRRRGPQRAGAHHRVVAGEGAERGHVHATPGHAGGVRRVQGLLPGQPQRASPGVSHADGHGGCEGHVRGWGEARAEREHVHGLRTRAVQRHGESELPRHRGGDSNPGRRPAPIAAVARVRSRQKRPAEGADEQGRERRRRVQRQRQVHVQDDEGEDLDGQRAA